MGTSAYINQIETAVPPFEGHSKFVELLRIVSGSPEVSAKLAEIDRHTRIERRHSVLTKFMDLDGSDPDAFYHHDRFPTTAERMARYQQEALPLAACALQRLLAPGMQSRITHLIVTSCTGFYAPGLDLDIVQHFDLRPAVERTLIGYMGCYAAVPGLKLARHIVRSDTSAHVLMVNLELCTLHWRKDVPLDQLVSCLLFADGCSASLISSEPVGLRLDQFHSVVLPNSQDLMRWTIGDDGFFMKLDARIPEQLGAAMLSDQEEILMGQSAQDIKLWAIHPGGPSIVNAIQSALQLDDAALTHSLNVLINYGNMSSPTVMFILKALLDDPKAQGPGCAMAFGPGLSLESLIFQKEA